MASQTIPIVSTSSVSDKPKTMLRDCFQNRLPIFIELDRTKLIYAKQIFESGNKVALEVEKQDIIPKRLFDEMMSIAYPEEARKMLKINEMLLDMHIVANIGDELDQAVKKAVLDYPQLRTGLAILNEHNYVFTECDKYGGVARDIKKVLKKVAAMMEQTNGHRPELGSIMTPYMPIPFEGSKLDYGTWGRPAVIDENLDREKIKLTLSLIEVSNVKRFLVNDKKQSGMHNTDVTENVQRIVAESELKEGFVLVNTLHTTVGIIKMNPVHTTQLYQDLLELAPADPSQYYHNRLEKRGELKLRQDGKPLGDGNGQSHVMASLIGFYTILPFRNGELMLENGERILHHDVDTLPPRERCVAVTIIKNPEIVSN